jgi:hypothetical protein
MAFVLVWLRLATRLVTSCAAGAAAVMVGLQQNFPHLVKLLDVQKRIGPPYRSFVYAWKVVGKWVHFPDQLKEVPLYGARS